MTSPWLLFLVLSLATYRLTRLITADLIPFGWLRERLITRWQSQGKSGLVKIEGITCEWCISCWLSAAVVAITDRLFHHLPLPVLYAAALSCVTGLIGTVLDKE